MNSYIGERAEAFLLLPLPLSLLDNNGYGIGLPVKFEGTTDGDALGDDV